jgi:hypothetical protein
VGRCETCEFIDAATTISAQKSQYHYSIPFSPNLIFFCSIVPTVNISASIPPSLKRKTPLRFPRNNLFNAEGLNAVKKHYTNQIIHLLTLGQKYCILFEEMKNMKT